MVALIYGSPVGHSFTFILLCICQRCILELLKCIQFLFGHAGVIICIDFYNSLFCALFRPFGKEQKSKIVLCRSFGKEPKSELLFVAHFVKSKRAIRSLSLFLNERKSDLLFVAVALLVKSKRANCSLLLFWKRAKERLPNPAHE